MDVNPNEIEVINNPDESRFEVSLNGYLAVVEYRLRGERMVFTHTEVPDELEGQGIASKMARVALGYAADNGLTIVPFCPFIRSYIKQHPDEYLPLVDEKYRAKLEAEMGA